MDEVEALPREDQASYLFLRPSDEYLGRWVVDSPWPEWFLDFEELVGAYQTISPARIDEFLDYADSGGYQVVFEEPPEAILNAFDGLEDVPPFSLNSGLENTVAGLLPWQLHGFNKLVRDEDLKSGLVVWDTGPQPLDADVLTPSGYVPMGDIRVGDRIIGSDGCSHAVTGIYPQGEQEVFRLTFKDESQAYSTGNHLWGFYDHVGNYSVRRLDEFVAAGLYHTRGDAKWFVDRVLPIEFDPQELPIDPYLLGVLLGDGSLTGSAPQLYSQEGEIVPLIERVLEPGMIVSQYGPKHFALVARRPGRYRNTLKYALKDLGLWGHTAKTKFIPDEYVYNTVANRLALLQGLLDTDGHAELQSARFYTISRSLAGGVMALVRSLGGRAKLSYREARQSSIKGETYDCQEGWIVSLSLPPSMTYFRLDRKKVKRHPSVSPNSLRAVASMGVQSVQCISVDAPDGRYVTQDYVLTHNTGKTAFIASAIRWHESSGHPYDWAFVVVKTHNKIDTQRKLLSLGNIYSTVVDGTKKRREKLYGELTPPGVIVLNYEKFRDDYPVIKSLVTNTDCLFFWDEMPKKLSNRTSTVYKSTKDVVWKMFEPRKEGKEPIPRPKWMRHWELSATPVENSPEGVFNTVRLMNPLLLGKVEEFDRKFVAYKNAISKKREGWHRLDAFEAKLEHMMHRASLADPEIRSMFPEMVEQEIVIDWEAGHRRVYDTLTGVAAKAIEEENVFEEANVLALIQVLQMVCDAPSMLVKAAENRQEWLEMVEDDPSLARKGSEIAQTLLQKLSKSPVDDKHTKLDTLKEILTEKHPDEKALVYMTWAGYGYAPLEKKLKEWDISYVSYRGTNKERQDAKDHFRDLDGPRVFLSSDAGSDSIDLPEAAIGVNYNLPWTWTRKRQRQGRNNRVDSLLPVTFWYDLLMAHSCEDRKAEIIATKRGYHEALFDKHAIDDVISAKLSREDLIYILTGQ